MVGNPNPDAPQSHRTPGPWRRRLSATVGLLALSGLGYCTSLYFTAEGRISQVCAQFTPGLTVAAVTRIAEAHGMNAPRSGASTDYVVESATFGRFGCKLEFKEDILQSATYDFQD
jgi:hypothetical protein